MCLRVVSKRKPKKSGYGYKLYKIRLSGGAELAEPLYYGHALRLDEWHTKGRRAKTIRSLIQRRYKAGFHVYKTYRAARMEELYVTVCIVRVEYRKAHTQGTQNGTGRRSDCIVADQIRIHKKDWDKAWRRQWR